MNKKEVYKEGINVASEVYEEKISSMQKNLKENNKRQDNVNTRNHMIQNELIRNTERIDEDLDKVYDMLGKERIPGNAGSVEFGDNAANNMTGYINGTLNKYNTISNLSALSVDLQLADAVASFLTAAVERDMNTKFHNKLSLLEKNGMLSQEKFERHKQSVISAKQLTGLGVYAAFSLAPIIDETIKNFLNKKEIANFVIGTYAYINHECTQLISYEITCLLQQMGIHIKEEKIKKIFEKYKLSSGLSHIPVFTKRNMNIFGNTGKEELAKEIVSRCDLHNTQVNERALEFIEDFMRMSSQEAKKIVDDSMYAQSSLSDITWFSAINYRYIFCDFIKDIVNARQFAFYDLENDVYGHIRESRKEVLENVIRNVNSKKNRFLSKGKRKDIIEASMKVMEYSLNPNYDISMDTKMIRRKMEVMEIYGLQ